MSGPELYNVGRGLACTDAGGTELISGLEASGPQEQRNWEEGCQKIWIVEPRLHLFYL